MRFVVALEYEEDPMFQPRGNTSSLNLGVAKVKGVNTFLSRIWPTMSLEALNSLFKESLLVLATHTFLIHS